MREVREYSSAPGFGKGIEEMHGKGWLLESWQMVPAPNQHGMIIVAVFAGCNR